MAFSHVLQKVIFQIVPAILGQPQSHISDLKQKQEHINCSMISTLSPEAGTSPSLYFGQFILFFFLSQSVLSQSSSNESCRGKT